MSPTALSPHPEEEVVELEAGVPDLLDGPPTPTEEDLLQMEQVLALQQVDFVTSDEFDIFMSSCQVTGHAPPPPPSKPLSIFC